ncbi:YcaO-like family protein [Rothia sp. 32237D007AR]
MLLENSNGEPDFSIYSSFLGDPSKALINQKVWSHSAASGNFDGAGGAIDPKFAEAISIVESIERYSSCAWDESEFIWATEQELGDKAVALQRWPLCSESEVADTRCRNILPDPRIPLRWVKGWSLTRKQEIFVPAFLVYLNFPAFSQSEMFANAVSTGTAAHSDIRRALLSGIQEVIERDSISLTWLQELPHPRIDIDFESLRPEVKEYVKVGTVPGIETHVFDATSDYGVPVLYAIQTSEHDDELAQVVAATCDLDPQRALAKLFRELASLRIALRMYKKLPPERRASDESVSVIGGAIENGRRKNRHRFDFLLRNNRRARTLATLAPSIQGEDPLDWIVSQLKNQGAECIAVDLTTDEARQAGQRVVKVLIPEAMPLSFSHYARYLAHPRLYAAPIAMGHQSSPEANINPNIQPFA